MADKLDMKVGDLEPSVKWQITSDYLTSIAGATVTFTMTAADGTPIITDQPGYVLNAADPMVVAYDWQAGDTDTVGKHKADFRLTISGRPFHAPNSDFFFVNIIEDA